MTTYLEKKPLRTDKDVLYFLAALDCAVVGTKVNCGNPKHSPQFRPVSDILTERVVDYIVWACRAGSKTYLYGGLDTFYKCASRSHYEVKILGGSEGQSQLSYDALKLFASVADPDGLHVRELLKTIGRFSGDSSASILTASSKSVRGPHPQVLKLDEVDEIDPSVYEDALSQPLSKWGWKRVLGLFSTNHNVMGQMDRALARAEEFHHAVYRYCIWECLESCRDYSCSTCGLSSICPGKQMKEADGYYKIADFMSITETLSWDTLSRDWLCIKTGLGDTVYEREWDDDIHIVAASLQQTPVCLSIDWGGTDPFSVGVWQKAPTNSTRFHPDQWIRVTEIYMTPQETSVTNPQVIARAKAAPWANLVKWVVPDNSRPDLIQEWRLAFPNAYFDVKEKRTIDEGIEAVKAALAPVTGYPKILINRICKDTRREVLQYKVKNDKPMDKDNHTWDEIRYFVLSKIKRSTGFSMRIPRVNPLP